MVAYQPTHDGAFPPEFLVVGGSLLRSFCCTYGPPVACGDMPPRRHSEDLAGMTGVQVHDMMLPCIVALQVLSLWGLLADLLQRGADITCFLPHCCCYCCLCPCCSCIGVPCIDTYHHTTPHQLPHLKYWFVIVYLLLSGTPPGCWPT